MVNRRPQVAPALQPAAHAYDPEHTDPTVRLVGRFPQPLSHRGELYQQPPSPFRVSVLEHPNIRLGHHPLIGDQTGDQIGLTHTIDAKTGMPASAWRLRRNYIATPAIEAGEAEV